jgi:transposase
VLLPELKIMDNASFHKSQKTKELIEAKDCNLIFLPPYSPDFNPIEKSWGSLKKLYRNYKHKYEDVYELIDLLLCNKYKTII